jgi:hypothetical protein
MLNDPSLLFDAERIAKKAKEVTKDRQSMSKAAEEYNSKYQEEVNEGTRNTQLLIENGQRKGLTEEEVLKAQGKFVPTVRTPILNWLYFLIREEGIDPGLERQRVEQNREFGHLQDDYGYKSENLQEPEDFDSVIFGGITNNDFQKLKKLKTLAMGSECNEHESALAFTICKELCKKLNIDFNKIPVNNKK